MNVKKTSKTYNQSLLSFTTNFNIAIIQISTKSGQNHIHLPPILL